MRDSTVPGSAVRGGGAAPGRRSAFALAGLLVAAGVTHLVNPKPYDRIVPRALPGSPRTYTSVSGVVELALAAGLVHPRTRRAAGLASAGFFAAVFPANVKMALDWRHAPPVRRAVAHGRLPLQLPLILWGLKVAREAPRSSPARNTDRRAVPPRV
ncbi:hypothetical protein OHA72_63045 [Dactylosporangium sp. NBC_01737]|uniref:DoxX family protein n=1 Tax=Dactylosporangium sp. NBC_01737 TaxID=2975959 RepID=UPI002E140876|nr:hypothetical protein OHA72_63045 [Dactylosporangium sp. NBC_01737]